jgi:hypothetical protein
MASSIKGRGAADNRRGRLECLTREAAVSASAVSEDAQVEAVPKPKTVVVLRRARSILSHIDSPDAEEHACQPPGALAVQASRRQRHQVIACRARHRSPR